MPASLVIRGGTVVDGTGAPGRAGPTSWSTATASSRSASSTRRLDAAVLDATGQVVAPGFVNVLSHAWGSLQTRRQRRLRPAAGRHHRGLRRGVLARAVGRAARPRRCARGAGSARTPRVEFDRLSQGLDHLERLGVAPNIASFIGGMNLRVLGAGFDDRPLEPAELDRLRALVDEEMADGALGIGTALIYPPGRFARTDELIALCEVVGRHGGTYISHMRSEGDQFLECLDELLTIGREAGCRTEVYHLKAAGPAQLAEDEARDRAHRAGPRRRASRSAANMYPYTAGGTALAASIPPRFHVGGPDALIERLADPAHPRADGRRDARALGGVREPLPRRGGRRAASCSSTTSPTALAPPASGSSEVAAELGLDDADALLEVVARDPAPGRRTS